MEIFLENMLKKFEAVKEIIELRQKLIEHYQQERQDNEFNTFGFSAQDQLKIKEKKIPHHICRVCREYNDLAYDYLFFNRRWYQFNRGEWKKFYTSFKKEVVQFT